MPPQARREKKKEKVENKLLNNLTNIYGKLIYKEEKSQNEQILENIRLAHKDWKNAEKYFQSVTEPELVDYAIFKMEAAKTIYTYLLKLAREKGIHGDM